MSQVVLRKSRLHEILPAALVEWVQCMANRRTEEKKLLWHPSTIGWNHDSHSCCCCRITMYSHSWPAQMKQTAGCGECSAKTDCTSQWLSPLDVCYDALFSSSKTTLVRLQRSLLQAHWHTEGGPHGASSERSDNLILATLSDWRESNTEHSTFLINIQLDLEFDDEESIARWTG